MFINGLLPTADLTDYPILITAAHNGDFHLRLNMVIIESLIRGVAQSG